jgi:conflict system pore-forming effector with SLATT domain
VNEMTERDYPSMFGAADRASQVAQRRYMLATKGTLLLLMLGAALDALAGELDSWKPVLAITSAVLLAMSLAVTVYVKTAKLERTWYGGRAVAESVKSLTWRYMMGAEPFPLDGDVAEVDQRFIANLASIVEERKELMFGFGGEASDAPQMSSRMRKLRGLTFHDRKSAYIAGRVRNQRQWYGSKAKYNRGAEEKYFVLVIVSQFLAVCASLAEVRWPDTKVHFTGFFAALASAFIAWLQVKQHRELAQAYSVAEFDLSLVEERAGHVADQKTLSAFVADAENAISREHTLWIARRDRS